MAPIYAYMLMATSSLRYKCVLYSDTCIPKYRYLRIIIDDKIYIFFLLLFLIINVNCVNIFLLNKEAKIHTTLDYAQTRVNNDFIINNSISTNIQNSLFKKIYHEQIIF